MNFRPLPIIAACGCSGVAFAAGWWSHQTVAAPPVIIQQAPVIQVRSSPLAAPEETMSPPDSPTEIAVPALHVNSGFTSTTPSPPLIVHPPAPPAITPPQSLEESALRVQNEANRELERLVPLLNLSDAQQDRVFSRLAENSVFWTPGLTAVGATETSQPSGTGTAIAAVPISDQTKSLTDLLTQPTSDGETPVLTPEQENAVVQDDLDRREWWTEMLGVIQGDMQSGTTTSAASTVTPVDPETITKEAEGADTVVD